MGQPLIPDAGVVENFVTLVENHCSMWGIPEQRVLIEGLRLVAKIIDDPELPGWLRRDAETTLWDSLDRLIHDPDYLDEKGLEPTQPLREPVTDADVLSIHEFLRQHQPDGLPSRAALVAELRRNSMHLTAVD